MINFSELFHLMCLVFEIVQVSIGVNSNPWILFQPIRYCLPKVLADDTNQDRMRSFLCVFKAAREFVSEYEA